MSDDMKVFKAGQQPPMNVFLDGNAVDMSAVEFYGSAHPNKPVQGWVIMIKRTIDGKIILVDGEIQYERLEGDIYWTPKDASST